MVNETTEATNEPTSEHDEAGGVSAEPTGLDAAPQAPAGGEGTAPDAGGQSLSSDPEPLSPEASTSDRSVSATASESADTKSESTDTKSESTDTKSESADTKAVDEQSDADAAPAVPTAADGQPLVISLAELTPEERFRATARLVFLAPDVPPVAPRQRRGSLRQLDDLLDQRFSAPSSAFEREGRDDRDDRTDGDDREVSSQRRTRSRNRRATNEAPAHEERDREEEAPRTRVSRQSQPITEPQKIRGSTRLEAKKQRRREGRDAGRRRRLVITESEFLARRESVDREMIVRTTADRVQIGVLEDKVLVEHYVARSTESSMIGNVYLGRVQNVLPSMEAAFVEIGRGRNAVLYSGEVDWSEFEGSNNQRRIESALKPGDQVLVQVTKDPIGHKGARLTSQISLPGRFLVYVPGGAMNGISRKLPDTERARLKKILKEVLPNGAGVIVRTAAEGATEEQLTHDVQRLTKQWESIQRRVAQGGGPVLLHSEPDMLIKIVRDVFNEDFHRLIISGEETYQTIENYLDQVAPELLERVVRYEKDRDIFDEYRVSEQIIKALDRKVWLPSGGSLVIDRTEAMTVVDVNTGKFVGSGGNLEETVTKNNLEAAEEIVRQLRLRDIGGIIVVDFIDMVLESNRDLVLRRLVECLSRDRTKHQVAEVTSLGLVQMTRKKLGLGLLESFSEPCEACAARGVIVHHEPVSRPRSNDGPSTSPRGRRKNSAQAQTHNQPAQTHSITDESRTMLAKIAAKTIPGASETAPVEDEQVEIEAKATSTDTTPAAPARQTTRRQSRRVRAEQGETSVAQSLEIELERTAAAQASKSETPQAVTASAEDLLGSVLDALPPAPEVSRRRANRRVSTASLSATTGPAASHVDSRVESEAKSDDTR